MKTMKTKLTITITALCIGAFVFFSCDNPVALGKKLNLDPPVVTIDKPDFMENVAGVLEITGTATDKEEIVLLEITVERVSKTGPAWKQEWRGERGAWQSRSADSSWTSRSGQGITWDSSQGRGKVSWSVRMSMDGAADGEYLITAGAQNNVKNNGSLQQRRVVIDNEPPVVSILMPIPEFDDHDLENEDKYDYAQDIYPQLSSYRLRDPAVLDKLHNKKIAIQYEVTDDFTLDRLAFQLAGVNEDNIVDDKEIYYNERETPVSNPGWSGKFEIPASEIKFPETHSKAGEVVDYGDDPVYLQLISIVSDKAGNERRRSHGWLVYWPDADKPWVEGVGHYTDPQQFKVYPGSDVQAQAYDNDGVHSVSYKIYTRSGGENNSPLIDEGTIINEPLEEDAAPSTFFNWSFIAPTNCDEYLIVLDCEDMYGTAGATDYRYFYVYDIYAPNIRNLSPDPAVSLFGDTNGTFTISGEAGDGVNPARLTLAWLKPGDLESLILYQSADYEGWNLSGSAPYTDSFSDGYWKDANGNIIWEISLPEAGTWDDTTKRMYKSFNKNLNLFADLHIGDGILLGAQSFVLRLEGATGRAVSILHSLRGDIIPPSLTIDAVEVWRSGSLVEEQDAAYLKENSLATLEPEDEIYVSGTWYDDSFTAWNDVSRIKSKVSWNVDFSLEPVILSADGTWRAGPLVLTYDEAVAGGGRIEAELEDYGGNITQTALTARVDTNVPVLMFASADKPDGYYKAGETIIIYLEFNKPVTFGKKDAAQAADPPYPTLTLNNDADATFDTNSNGTTRHAFTYTVVAGDDTREGGEYFRLDIKDINFADDSAWKAESGIAADVKVPAQNLAKSKNIIIDTVPPAISGVESFTGAGYYNAGKEIYLLLTFSEDIQFDPGVSGDAQLNLDSGGEGVSPVLYGDDSLLFTYRILGGHNANPLTASGFTLNSANVTDLAGNTLSSTAITGNNINEGTEAKVIVVDTIPPGAPTLKVYDPSGDEFSGTTDNTFTVNAGQSVTFTIDGEDGAALEYRLKNPSSSDTNNKNSTNWIPYDGEGSISATGNHTVEARQTDRAGNVGTALAGPVGFTIKNSDPLLRSFGGSPPRTYTLDDGYVEIYLNFRGNITVNGGSPTLTLQNITKTTGTLTATYNRAEESRLIFRYPIVAGDNSALSGGNPVALEITSINLSGANLFIGTDNVTSELKTGATSPNGGWESDNVMALSEYTAITINTNSPSFTNATLSNNGQTLTLNFAAAVPIYKGTGDITLTQQGTYLAPAVMSKNDFLRWGGVAGSGDNNNLGYYYEAGTNGTDPTGKPDTTEQYILKYQYDTDNANLVAALKAKNADKVIVSVVSGAVAGGGGGNSLTVTLTTANGYPLRVKGVDYQLSFPPSIAQDALNNPLSNTTTTINGVTGQIDGGNTHNNPSVNPPFIRVNKAHEQVQADGQNRNADEAVFTTTTEVDPDAYWIKDANLKSQEQQPTEAGTWVKLADFTVVIPRGDATTTGVTYISTDTSGIRIGGGDQALAQGGRLQPGSLASRDSGGTTYYVSDGWGGGGNAENIWGNPDGPGLEEMSPYYVNPYDPTFEIHHFGGVNDHTLTANWSHAGTFYVEHLWVNTATGTKVTTKPTDERGYLIVGGAITKIEASVTINAPAGVTGLNALQPLTTDVKIDSQTPTATISYTYNQSAASVPFAGPFHLPGKGDLESITRPSVSMPGASGTSMANGGTFSIGTTADLNGYAYAIRAEARTVTPAATSSAAYEKAVRSVVMFRNVGAAPNWDRDNTGTNGNHTANNQPMHLWIRGGDDLDGANITPGFPMNWDENDYQTGVAGARLMTGTNEGTKYWITWEVTVPAYFHFLKGTVYATANQNNANDIMEKGPIRWGWAKNGWAFQHHQFILYPGGSLIFFQNGGGLANGTTVDNPGGGSFEFLLNGLSGRRD